MTPESEMALVWNDPKILVQVEKARYPYQRAIQKIIADTFKSHISRDALILEVGSGLGYMRSLMPDVYCNGYFSSDFSVSNLREGLRRRELNAVAASAHHLPFFDRSVDCVVDLDAYDTMPNLGKAVSEVARVLTPDGTFIHFQVNHPSEDTVWFDHPDHIFFPQRIDKNHVRGSMIGVRRDELEAKIPTIKIPELRNLLKRYLIDPEKEYVMITTSTQAQEFIDMLNDIVDVLPLDRLVIPSVPDYFKYKIEKEAQNNNLEVVESEFKWTSIRGQRFEHQDYPYNYFTIDQGSARHRISPELQAESSTDVIETASVLTFVAKKTK